jgi:hypothetical protein
MTAESMNADSLRNLVSSYLNERWQGVYQNSRGACIVPDMGNTSCLIDVVEAAESRLCLDIHAPIILAIPPSAELFEIVALSANNWDFGALNLFTDGGAHVLEFKYVLVVESISSSLLNFLVNHVGATASQLAVDYRDAFGGRLVGE